MLSYTFVRSGQLTSREFHLLSIIDSFSGESHLKVAQYAEMMLSSVRTIKRTLRSLKEKGFIQCRYGIYKSIHLSINNLANAVWKPNLKKIFKFSKGPNKPFKRANGGPSNIEGNKENNKPIRYPEFKSEDFEHPGGKEIPVPENLKNVLAKFLKK